MSSPMHCTCVDHVDNRLAVPHANFRSSLYIRRQMYMLAAHLEQTITLDQCTGLCTRAVIQHVGWFDWLQAQIDLHTVPLVGTNLRASRIDREALLVTGCDDLL